MGFSEDVIKFGPILTNLLHKLVIDGYSIFTYNEENNELEPILVVDKTKELEKDKTIQKMLTKVPMAIFESFLLDKKLDITLKDHTTQFYNVWNIDSKRTFVYIYNARVNQLAVIFTKEKPETILKHLIGEKIEKEQIKVIQKDFSIPGELMKLVENLNQKADLLTNTEKDLIENIKYITEALNKLTQVIGVLKGEIDKILTRT